MPKVSALMGERMRILTRPIHVKEITDHTGDLVDLEFRCNPCFQRVKDGSYYYWYKDYREAIRSDFSENYHTYCKGCDRMLVEVGEDD